jgi:hypothetical protein
LQDLFGKLLLALFISFFLMPLKRENPLAQELQYWILTRLYLSTLGLSFPWHGLLGQPLGIPEKNHPKVLSKIPNPNSQALTLSLSLSLSLSLMGAGEKTMV